MILITFLEIINTIYNKHLQDFFYIVLIDVVILTMKEFSGVMLASMFMMIWAPVVAQNEKEKEAIKAVIEQETASFMNLDYKTWSSLWLKVPYAYWSYSDSSGTSYIEGWDNLNSTYADYFNNSKPSKAEITNEWIEIRVFEDGAYAHFVQKTYDEIDRDETSQIRVLEKKDGKWKLICVGAIAKYPP
jgi:hypothetical protein